MWRVGRSYTKRNMNENLMIEQSGWSGSSTNAFKAKCTESDYQTGYHSEGPQAMDHEPANLGSLEGEIYMVNTK